MIKQNLSLPRFWTIILPSLTSLFLNQQTLCLCEDKGTVLSRLALRFSFLLFTYEKIIGSRFPSWAPNYWGWIFSTSSRNWTKHLSQLRNLLKPANCFSCDWKNPHLLSWTLIPTVQQNEIHWVGDCKYK